MFNTPFGTRNLIRRYIPAELAASFASPVPGQLVCIAQAFTLALTARKKKKALIVPPGEPGKLQLASAASTGSGEIDGIVVKKMTDGSIAVAPPGEMIPLWLFGTGGGLRAYGGTNILYLSSSDPGVAVPTSPGSGNYQRRVIRCPKNFDRITDADVDPQNPDAIYVMLVEERPYFI